MPHLKDNAPAASGMTDEQLLDGLLHRLKTTKRMEFVGEFGTELATFMPLVSWLKHEGHLSGCEVVTYSGMRPFYFFLDEGQLVEREGRRQFLRDDQRYWPTNRLATATLKPWHRPPDFRAHYAPVARRFAKPTLFIQNKFAVEWRIGPINYIPLHTLGEVLDVARERFQVVYTRPRPGFDAIGYSRDDSYICEYPDRQVLATFPGAIVLEEVAKREGRPYNEVQLEMLAGAHLFLAAQGGGTQLLAAFSNSFLAVVHRRGNEFPHSYAAGSHKYLADPPPELFVARRSNEVGRIPSLFAERDVRDGRVVRLAPTGASPGGTSTVEPSAD